MARRARGRGVPRAAAASSCRWTASTARSCSASRAARAPTCGGSCSPRPAARFASGRPSSSRAPRSPTRCSIPPGAWAARSPIDSATLANKALEVIEAHFLFGLPYDRIEVVVHPQSVVHSFVEFVDGSVLAQLGVPSMELPVLYALTHPERVRGCRRAAVRSRGAVAADVRARAHGRFPGARARASRPDGAGGVAPAVFNAANEQAVAFSSRDRISIRGHRRARSRARWRAAPDGPGDTRDALLDRRRAARVDTCWRCSHARVAPHARRHRVRVRPRDLRPRARTLHRGEGSWACTRRASPSASARRSGAASGARPNTCSPRLPLGGYVRMASREDESMAFLEGGAETPVATVGASGAPADRTRREEAALLRSERHGAVRSATGAGESLARIEAARRATVHHARRRDDELPARLLHHRRAVHLER